MAIKIRTGRAILLWHSATDRHRLEPTLREAARFLRTSVKEVRRLVASGEATAESWYVDYADPRQVKMFAEPAVRPGMHRV